jgi:LPS export ABC transporter protein LptC
LNDIIFRVKIMKRALFVLFFLFGLSSGLDAGQKKPSQKQEGAENASGEQKMMDFSLAGYTQKGKKSWEVKGNSADISSDIIHLRTVSANVYGEEENINLVGDKGAYDKTSGRMHLEDNVVITTQSGGRLTTDSLDWDRNSKKVTTNDIVNIEKQNIKAVARGLEGQSNLKKVYLKDEVKVEVKEQGQMLDQPNPKGASKEPTIITCDGPLEIDYEKEIATFNNNVKVDQKEQGEMYADKMVVHFDFKNKKVLYIKSTGNVKIIKGENISYSDEAVYTAAEKKMILTGRPRLVIHSEEKLIDAPSGN